MTTNDTLLRVGIAGFGYAGMTFHAPLIRTTPGLTIAAVSSRDPAKVHAHLGAGVRVLSDAADLAGDPGIDLLVIASPNATHAPLAATALAHGKHVAIDKPFAATVEEAAGLIALAAAHQRVLSVFHNRRWDSTTRTAQRLLADGTLGPVRYAALHFDRFRPQPQARWKEDLDAGGGLWMDLGPHLLDEALLYFGTPLAIQADLATLRPGGRADDQFHARLRYADGLRVDLHASMLAAVPRPRLLLQGLRGTWVKQGLDPQESDLKAGRLPGSDAAPWGIDAERGLAVVEQGGMPLAIDVATENGDYPAYYRQLRDAILGRGPNPVPPQEALAVMRLLDAGRRSALERREVVFDEA
jgi:predicted dehydrogenase